MSGMSLPGFTAEVSVYNTRVHYQLANALDQGGGAPTQQLVPQSCLPVGDRCRGNFDCCTGWCNENNQCDCFDLGDECRLGPQSCCSGICVDGICAPPAAINVSWARYVFGGSGIVVVRGSNFAPNSQLGGSVSNCQGPFNAPLVDGGAVTNNGFTDSSGNFEAWVFCDCGGSTNVIACDSHGNCAEGSAQIPC